MDWLFSTQLILQPSHFIVFLSISLQLPELLSVPFHLSLLSIQSPRKQLLLAQACRGVEVLMGRLHMAPSYMAPRLYLLHGGISTQSSLTIASGLSGSFMHSCFKAFISSPVMCFQALSLPFLPLLQAPASGKPAWFLSFPFGIFPLPNLTQQCTFASAFLLPRS